MKFHFCKKIFHPQEDVTERLGTETINKLLLKMSLPSVLGMLSVTVYNITDTFFIGNGIGKLGIAGLSVCLPILMTMGVFGQAIGIGGASVISRLLGERRAERANLTLRNMMTIIFIINAVTFSSAYAFIEPLLRLFGANAEIMPFAKEYLLFALPGTFSLNIFFVQMNSIRAEGDTRFAMITQVITSTANIIIDPIFIYVFDWGMAGAAAATSLTQTSSMLLTWRHLSHNKLSALQLHKNRIFTRIDKRITKEIFAIGISSFGRQMASSVMAVALNNTLLHYCGTIAVAAFGLIHRLTMFILMPLFGINQGFMPIAGYNYGARQNQRVVMAYKSATVAATVFSTVMTVIFLLFAKPLICLFTDDVELAAVAATALMISVSAFPINGFQIVGSGTFQALGKAKASFFLSIARQLLFLIPFVVLLPLLWGGDAIWFAFPASDCLTAAITLIMVRRLVRQLKS